MVPKMLRIRDIIIQLDNCWLYIVEEASIVHFIQIKVSLPKNGLSHIDYFVRFFTIKGIVFGIMSILNNLYCDDNPDIYSMTSSSCV